jgi:hypothetical protein
VLSRDFEDAEINQVLTLVNQMFDRRWEKGRSEGETASTESPSIPIRRRHLH